MIEDLDVLYNDIENVSRNIHKQPKEDRYTMAKIINYSLRYNTNVEVTLPLDNAASQYQEVIIQATLDETFYDEPMFDGFTVMMYISDPTDIDVGNNITNISTDEYESKFANKFFLRPIIGKRGVFQLHLNEIMGRDLIVGVKNKCKFVFKVIIHNKVSGQYEEKHMKLLIENSPIALELYKTNVDYSTKVDNITNAFIALDDIKEALSHE